MFVLAFAALVAIGPPQSAPPLPEVALSTFPPAARDALGQVYRRAAGRPSDAQAVGELGRWLHAWEQFESAHQAYARAQRLAPKDFDWQYLDAIVLQRLARHDEAASRLSAASAINPQYLPARIKLAEAVFEAGDLERSAALFEALAGEPLAEPAAQAGLGRIAAMRGAHERAIAHFERAVTLFPEFGAAHYGLARSYRALGRNDDAAREQALHARYGPRWPGTADPVLAGVATLREDPRATLLKGVSLAETGDIKAAIVQHEAALAKDPSLLRAHVNLISLYGRAGDWANAERHYRAATAAGVNNAEAHYDYAVILGLQQKWDEAATVYRRALDVNPLHVESRNNLGLILERRREFGAAASEYRQAVDAKPTLRLARFNLGRMLLVLGRNDEAILEFEKLLEPKDSETPGYAFALATAYVRTGRKDEGIKWATEARRLALANGQTDLAAAIDRELEKLK